MRLKPAVQYFWNLRLKSDEKRKSVECSWAWKCISLSSSGLEFNTVSWFFVSMWVIWNCDWCCFVFLDELDTFGQWPVKSKSVFFASAVNCCDLDVLVSFYITCLRVLSANHCDLFCRFWKSCHVVAVGCIVSVMQHVSVFLHVLSVRSSLHIA